MVPEINYYRFNPVDDRRDMQLDETNPTAWLKLEAATDQYIQNNSPAFKKVGERLLLNHSDEKLLDNLNSQQFSRPMGIIQEQIHGKSIKGRK
ncbi:hypothetical protein HanPSC8_Chr12g0538061 [Helianthus annuus]|nr:hypothetical protein HanPSC8_Chr12g0538061 [Helianthus annuus]